MQGNKMGHTRISQMSFSRGEIAPALQNRTDIEQYSISLKTLKNGFVHQEGCVSNRSGFEFVGQVKDSTKKTRLIPFVFNSEQTYIIEAGEKYFRFIQNGGYIVYSSGEHEGEIVEIETPYLESDLQFLKYAQSADILTITHQNYPPKELARYNHDDWRLSDILFQAQIAPPSNVTARFNKATPTSNQRTYTYLVTAVKNDTYEESVRSATASVVAHRESQWETSEQVDISWQAVEGACEYNVYRAVNSVFGYIGTSQSTSFTDDNIEPDMNETAPMGKNPFENDNNPSCCAYFQQRKLYGNTVNSPQTIYASQTATSNNFNYSRPLIASDSVEMVLADREVNEIRHLIPFKDLVVLTSNSEYKVNGSDGVFQANPMPVAVIQSCYGSSHVQPIVSGSMVLFVQSGGSVLRDLGYEYLSDGYDGDELSLFSSHLFEGKEIIYIAYAKEPYRLVYVVFNDGSAAVLTYNKKQKLCGWGRWITKGKFESVATVREGQEDVAYFIIKRNLNGQNVRCVERQKTRIINNVRTAFFVDCGMSAHFDTPKTEFSGLNHLANEKVIVLADGGVFENITVSQDGKITVPKETTDIVVGLPYEFEFETLGIEGENTHGLKKIINSISVNILKSREDFFVVGNNGMENQLSRSMASINDSGFLFSGNKSAMPLNTPSEKATIHIKQKYPLPLTISSVSAVVNIEDI
jgi:hypothetical protein